MTIQRAGTSLAVDIQQVGKRFKRHTDRRNSIKERLVRGRARKPEDFWAVRDVTLQIPKGSVYGLIGHNGSGKSTLLKMIGGIYRPTEGSIATDGRVAALIELGAGFHPDMTGRENINLNGSILGLPRKDIQAVTEEIIEFSGLGDFINDPVKHYSSGMYVRLGFSVAVHMKPDVLVVDEVLAVGDEEFQRKCFDHLYALRRSGRTIIVVSHGLGQAARNPQIGAVRDDVGDPRAGDQSIRVRSAKIVDLDGQPMGHAETGTTFQISLEITARESVLGPNVRIALQHESGPLVTMVSNHRVGTDFGIVEGELTIDVALVGNPLLPGRYRVHVDVFDFSGSKLLDSWNDAVEFPVRSQSGEIGQGFVQLPVEFRLS